MSHFLVNPYAFKTLLLDAYGGAEGAYSLRKLRDGYTGSVIRVRRSNDNAEQDIGFDAEGNLDESALTSFVGANSGFVTTWYDQSGNGRNATQTTSGNQPRIVNSGTVDKDGTRACLKFDGSDDRLTNTAIASVFTGSAKQLSTFSVARFSTANAVAAIWGIGSTTSNTPLRYLGLSLSTVQLLTYQDRDDANVNTAFVRPNESVTSQMLVSTFSNGTDSRSMFRDGVSKGTNTVSVGTTTLNVFSIGALVRTGLTHPINGNIQEIIIYNTDASSNRATVEANVNAYYSIY